MTHAAHYVYECPAHGRFEVPLKFGDDVPTTWPCPALFEHERTMLRCNENGKRVILPPAGVFVEGGTGARSAG